MGFRRQWQHKSVRALMHAAGSTDPETIIRLRATNLVERAKAKGWSGPPYCPLQLASFLGIKCEEVHGLFSAEAQLVPIGRQLQLEFNPARPQGRRNYSICHEIIHTFFDDCYEIVHQRKSSPSQYDPDRELEYLCQVGAAELLMPENDFRNDLVRLGFSLANVPYLAQRFDASREAIIRRIVSLSTFPCAAVFLSRRLSPTQKTLAQTPSLFRDLEPIVSKMRVIYVAASASWSTFIPRDKSIPDDSCIYQLNEEDHVLTQIEEWDIRGLSACHVECMSLPLPGDCGELVPTAVALLSKVSDQSQLHKRLIGP